MAENIFSRPPAHGRIANWLGPQLLRRLLDHAQEQRENFDVTGLAGAKTKESI